MKSLEHLYKIGAGPSSSHTMGPKKACEYFLEHYPSDSYEVVLYESLAFTGVGHLTDYIIKKTLPNVEIIFDYKSIKPHPNTMLIRGYRNNEVYKEVVFYSVGGGRILIENEEVALEEDIYPHKTFSEIYQYLTSNNLTIPAYIDQFEKLEFAKYLEKVLETMEHTLNDGLNKEDNLPGKLNLKRKAKNILNDNKAHNILLNQDNKRLIAYAYAVAEENASGGDVVTAPTCGACGVLPAVMFYLRDIYHTDTKTMLDGLKVAGLIGNIVKENASISGAEAGCQAEIGTATSMAAAYTVYIFCGSLEQIERASEIALEHQLGLTCDPVAGYVQIPCIERNAVAALRAIDSAKLAMYLDSKDAKISFDTVVKTMLETGTSLPRELRETSEGGLAKKYVVGDCCGRKK